MYYLISMKADLISKKLINKFTIKQKKESFDNIFFNFIIILCIFIVILLLFYRYIELRKIKKYSKIEEN